MIDNDCPLYECKTIYDLRNVTGVVCRLRCTTVCMRPGSCEGLQWAVGVAGAAGTSSSVIALPFLTSIAAAIATVSHLL
jgi:hypothetical protein